MKRTMTVQVVACNARMHSQTESSRDTKDGASCHELMVVGLRQERTQLRTNKMSPLLLDTSEDVYCNIHIRM